MYRVNRCSVTKLQDLFRFLERNFPNNQKQSNRDRWNWLFFRNPGAYDGCSYWLLESEGRVVGTAGTIPVKVVADAAHLDAAIQVDLLVEEQFKGLPALALLKKSKEFGDIHIAINLSPAARNLFLRLKYHDFSDHLHELCYPMLARYFAREKGFLGYSITLARIHLKNLWYEWLRDRILSRQAQQDYRVKIDSHLDPDIEKLWTTISCNFRFSIVKDYRYLQWRYEHRPDIAYDFIHIYEDSALRGVIVAAVIPSTIGEMEGYIFDLIADFRQQRLIEFGISHALVYFKNKRAIFAKLVLLNDSLAECFIKMGFRSWKSSQGLMIDIKKESPIDHTLITDPQNWHIITGDSDLI